jgi:hypothetical protein
MGFTRFCLVWLKMVLERFSCGFSFFFLAFVYVLPIRKKTIFVQSKVECKA